MMITRRSLLKFLAIAPIAAPITAVCTAVREPTRIDALPKPSVWVNPYISRGTLMVLVGPPKNGKTALARWLTSRHGMYLMDDCEKLTDPAADCDFLVTRGISVLAVVRSDRQVKNDLLSMSYGGKPTTDMMHQADWVFYVGTYGFDRMTAPGVRNFWWQCSTLKDRFGSYHKNWTWNTTGTTWPHIDTERC